MIRKWSSQVVASVGRLVASNSLPAVGATPNQPTNAIARTKYSSSSSRVLCMTPANEGEKIKTNKTS
ncbi:hypothetical protein Pmani_018974 [Petrolisthes manimaculis]|uniref:Uncharacterized protein n=1 Tax=Petrolisthes manimaculis TaxID=1843537 RepID=A0AAE1PLS8_9EUCA|nr:hypothetical protein Pmani_018974 [Petrolisthes manimaculis]